jgi:hypothetical protein
MFSHSPVTPSPYLDGPSAPDNQPATSSIYERMLAQPGGVPSPPQQDAQASPVKRYRKSPGDSLSNAVAPWNFLVTPW